MLFSEHLEGNGANLYIVLGAKRKSGLMNRSAVKVVVQNSVIFALTRKVLFLRKDFVGYVYQSHSIVTIAQLFQFVKRAPKVIHKTYMDSLTVKDLGTTRGELKGGGSMTNDEQLREWIKNLEDKKSAYEKTLVDTSDPDVRETCVKEIDSIKNAIEYNEEQLGIRFKPIKILKLEDR